MASVRPFQSQSVTRLLRTYRGLAESARESWDWLRLGVVWGIQVALYPFYVAAQSGRTLYRRLRAAEPMKQWRKLLGEPPPPLSEAEGSDWSDQAWGYVLQSLQETQAWMLRQSISAVQVADAPSLAQVGELATAGSATGVVQTPLSAAAIALAAVRGIACWLDTGTLMLVDDQNQPLPDLPPDLQMALERAMLYVLAMDYYQFRQRQQRLNWQGPLPMPVLRRRTWWPIQLIQWGLAWMQVGPVAIATNLFHEAETAQLVPVSPHDSESEDIYIPFQPLLLPKATPHPRHFRPPFGSVPLAAAIEVMPSHSTVGVVPQSTAAVNVYPSARLANWVQPSEASPVVLPPQGAMAQNALETVTPTAPPVASASADSPVAQPPDWIETRATLMGYVEHPLVTVLHWLDQALLKVERWLQHLWRWLVDHF